MKSTTMLALDLPGTKRGGTRPAPQGARGRLCGEEPPDEPTPLDLDHVKRAKFSPPHEPAEASFDGVPSLVDGNFLPAWI